MSRRRGARHRARLRLLLPIVFVVAIPLLAWAGERALRIEPDCRPADALAVLAGAEAYRERAEAAAALFHRGVAPRIVLTNDGVRGGWSQEQRRNPLFVERTVAELQAWGVPPDRIEVVRAPVGGTDDEAVRLRAWADSTGVASLVVVTSVYHARRTRLAFDREFRGATARVGICGVAGDHGAPHPATWWLTRRGWRDIGAEFPKLVVYALRGRDGRAPQTRTVGGT